MDKRNAALTALVVDDSRTIRELVSAMLEAQGIGCVEQAEDGVSAFRAIDRLEKPVDLLFCDLAMPGVDGVETLRGLAARNIQAGVVLLSGVDPKLIKTVADMAEQLGLRVLGSVAKPFREEQIAEVVAQYHRICAPKRGRPALTITGPELDAAIDDNRIEVFYQPKVRVADSQVAGVEALVRMRHPAYGLIQPDAFIDIAEETSKRITRLTLAVLGKAIAQAGEWRRSGLDLGLAVNVSTQALRRLDLPDMVEDMASKAGVDHTSITMELTESQVMGTAEILHILSRFRLRNFKLSIDDFGTGHSSLARLRRLPFTELKIDRSFVDGASEDADLQSILTSSIELGKRLRMTVVAEGVERWADWRLLERLGVDQIQGYIASLPIAASDIPGFVKRWTERAA